MVLILFKSFVKQKYLILENQAYTPQLCKGGMYKYYIVGGVLYNVQFTLIIYVWGSSILYIEGLVYILFTNSSNIYNDYNRNHYQLHYSYYASPEGHCLDEGVSLPHYSIQVIVPQYAT